MQGYISRVEEKNTTLFKRDKAVSIAFSGCNFRCPWCFVPELLDFKEQRDIKEIEAEIRRTCPGKREVIFSGGEPLLQKHALAELLRFSKSLGLRTGIETNGSKPAVLDSLLKQDLLDFVSLDIKTPFDEEHFERATQSQTFFISSYQIMQDVRKSLKLLERSSIEVEIRTVIIPSILFRKEDVLQIASDIKDMRCTWRLLAFVPGNCVSKQIERIEAPSERFLETLADACQERYPQLRIEVGSHEETPILY